MSIRNFIFWLSTKKKITDAIGRRGVHHGFALRFIAGETLGEALNASAELNANGSMISLNHLGENVITEDAARQVRDEYIDMLRELAERNVQGNISIKLTQLGLDLDRDICRQFTREIAAAARAVSRDIEIDMEGSGYTDVTIDIFESVRREFNNVGMAIQAYLFRTEKDLERLKPLTPKIRLVKGAYREPPKIAYQKKSDVDANYCKLLDILFGGGFLPAVASHDPAMVQHARELILTRGIKPGQYEFQMIYGIRRDLQAEVRGQGHPLRIYVPYGTEWCPYFMRRLSERPANCWFVLRSLIAEKSQSHTGKVSTKA